jgi:hypothetical protein
MESINEILEDRGIRYGEFKDQALISQAAKAVILTRSATRGMEAYQVEAMEMIIHKMSRIVNGDPDYVDSWRDIEGYAKLVADQLERQ